MVQVEDAATSSSTMQTLGLAWWNTGLSPNSSPNRANDEERETAAAMLAVLCHMRKDFIALGEVSTGDIEIIRGICGMALVGYEVEDSTDTAGRSRFDTAVVYRRDALTLVGRRNLTSMTGGRTARLGQHFEMITNDDGRRLHLIVSHWPSRLMLHEDAPKRFEFGMRLRDIVDELLSIDSKANIVLLGDYNDEPFDDVISASLRATRDKQFAGRRRELLYNPFWRHLTSYEHADSKNQSVDRGTYFHAAGDVTRWRTFDHMMFSSSLVTGTNGWELDEHSTRVLSVPAYNELVQARKHVFDHLPIVGSLIRSAAYA